MYKKGTYTILQNKPLASGVWRMTLRGDTQWITSPGQFVDIALEGHFLRRPISVCDCDADFLTIIYKVVGDGTAQMARMTVGTQLDLLTGLGNGFDTEVPAREVLLVGGGVGVPPLYYLAKKLLAAGKRVNVALGFNAAADVFYADEFRALGCSVELATLDGSAGQKGFVTDAIASHYKDFDYFYACGPQAMLRALCRALQQEGQLSLEERMGCGFGACMGCSCQTRTGSKRVCKDGPVFLKSELLWTD